MYLFQLAGERCRSVQFASFVAKMDDTVGLADWRPKIEAEIFPWY